MAPPLNLAAVNLNLLVALDALLREQSVTVAARRVGVSQSAMSQSLAQLRVLLDDPLLVRDGRLMLPTPRAEAIRPGLQRVLGDLAQVLRADATFSPASLQRRFVIASVDVVPYMFAPALVRHLRSEAPGVELVFEDRDRAVDRMREGSVDLLFQNQLADEQGLARMDIPSDTFVPVLRRGHPAAPAAGEPLSFETWASIPQIMVGPALPRTNYVDEFLKSMGLERTVALRVQSALSCARVLEETDLCWNTARVGALAMQRNFDIELHRLPAAMPSFPFYLYWHERWSNDPGHRYLRGLWATLWDG